MDAKKPLISVIVPVYNVEKYLPKCLDSLLAQTWQLISYFSFFQNFLCNFCFYRFGLTIFGV